MAKLPTDEILRKLHKNLISCEVAAHLLLLSQKYVACCKAVGRRCSKGCQCPKIPQYGDPPLPPADRLVNHDDHIRVYAWRASKGFRIFNEDDEHGPRDHQALVIEKRANGRHIKADLQVVDLATEAAIQG